MSKVILTEEDVRLLWIALCFGKTLGDRIPIGVQVLGPCSEDIFMDDDTCPLCGRGKLDE